MSLKKRTKIALDESRTLMLGAQILFGFQLHGPFQNAFAALPLHLQQLHMSTLGIMVVVVGLLIAPSAHHRIVEQGRATVGINRFITRLAFVTLLPFATALGLDLFIAGERIAGAAGGAFMASAGFLLSLGCWYGPLFLRKREAHPMTNPEDGTPTSAKIEYVLTECRLILPGAQALLGFQFAIVLTQGFADLSQAEQLLHGAALGFVAVSTILLMTPAAYHRIVFNGEEVPEFYEIASRFVLAATVAFALGLGADIHVVIARITDRQSLAHLAAASTLILLIGLWYIWPMLRRYSTS